MSAGRLAQETAWQNLTGEAKAELRRQHAKWGEQNHADGTGYHSQPLLDFTADASSAGVLADLVRESVDRAADEERSTWSGILLEEVFQALAEDDPAVLRAELIQVAAVALQWAGAIDRRANRGA